MTSTSTPLTVVLQGVVGSSAYGLAHEGSDVDRLGIYVAPIREVLGLAHDKVINHTDVQLAPNPDKSTHEIAKYLSLALQGNPTILELLFLNEYEIVTEAGKLLIKQRAGLLGSKAIKARYGGYATSQAERLKRGHDADEDIKFPGLAAKRTEKHGRHCARLLLQGAELLRTGRIQIDVSQHRDFLFETGRLALTDVDAFYARFLKMREELDNLDSVLPEVADRTIGEDLCTAIRLGQGREWLMEQFQPWA